MKIRRSLALGVGAALLIPIAASGAGATAAPEATVTKATTWLGTQQQADGGFEVSGFPGFETPDAVLAIAAASQTGPGWDTAAAVSAVEAVTTGGKDALDALDDLAEASLATADPENDPTNNAGAARAAKLIALDLAPLGLSATDFDPSGDSAEPVDLLAVLGAHQQEDGSYDLGALFNGVLYTAVALEATGSPVPAGLVAQIKGGQRADGSWDYTGASTGGPGDDVDTTALALLALKSAGLRSGDAAVDAGVAFLASSQQATGAWQAFGADDPNSTSMASLALSALQIDVTTSGWRSAAGHPASGAYVSPQAWLRSQQAADGHITGPNDGWGVNTFATSQSVQALARQRFQVDERDALLASYSRTLASPAADPTDDRSVELASDTVGPNVATKSARTASASAVVNGVDGRQAAAADLFQQAFDRAIDPSGRNYWSTKLISISRPEMLSRLTGSNEFYRKAGGTTPTFVDTVYQRVLGRAADPSGRTYWINRLNAGRSVESVARSLVASNEYRRHQVNDAFDRILDRAPTTGERDYWTPKIATTRIEVLLATLAASGENLGRVTAP
jgi:hypothetical protein